MYKRASYCDEDGRDRMGQRQLAEMRKARGQQGRDRTCLAAFRIPDPNPNEPRFRTAARASDGRPVFIVYTHRERDGRIYLRPVSARYMHEKEVRDYEQIEKTMANPAD
jgi:uncharacterized DUF497 family protein